MIRIFYPEGVWMLGSVVDMEVRLLTITPLESPRLRWRTGPQSKTERTLGQKFWIAILGACSSSGFYL